MGCDYLAAIGCPLQQQLGDDFLPAVKLLGMAQHLEAQRAALERQSGKPLESIAVRVGATTATVGEVRAKTARVEGGIPACPTCPVSGGEPLGCYRYVTYPVDVELEEVALEFFVETIERPTAPYAIATDPTGRKLTAAALVLDHVIAELPARSPWHDRRGPASEGGLATRKQPVVRELPSRGRKLDSASVLAAMFQPIDGDLALQLYAYLFEGVVQFAVSRNVHSRSLAEVEQAARLLRRAERAAKAQPVAMVVDG
jgi:hypothetical protein